MIFQEVIIMSVKTGLNGLNGQISGQHGLILQNCENLSVSGVTDVDSFDEKKIKLFTECGELAVFGENLHVNEMSVGSGSVTVEGSISALIYGDKSAKKRLGFFGRIFR
jgi:sporulation protein YabP